MQNYYDNPKQYAVTLQEAAYDSFKAKKIHGYGLQERSIYSAYYVFTALMYWRKHINQEQFRGSTKKFMEILPETEPIEAIIYLRLPESTALERIKLRGRKEEANIELEYLNGIQRLYDNVFLDHWDSANMIGGTPRQRFQIPVYVLDATANRLEEIVVSCLTKHGYCKQAPFVTPKLRWNLPRPLMMEFNTSHGRWEEFESYGELTCDCCGETYHVRPFSAGERSR